MTTCWALPIALAACGDNAAERDASVACSATFSGNFAEFSSADQCATLAAGGSGSSADATLALTIPTSTLTPAVKMKIDFGPSVSDGSYSSETVSSWTAQGLRDVGQGACAYNGGATAVPTGDFALHVDSVDAATGSIHGAIAITLYVLAFPGTDCGDGDTERVDVRF